ncbi:hypothetical protein D9M72_419920 [compost metagenome]
MFRPGKAAQRVAGNKGAAVFRINNPGPPRLGFSGLRGPRCGGSADQHVAPGVQAPVSKAQRQKRCARLLDCISLDDPGQVQDAIGPFRGEGPLGQQPPADGVGVEAAHLLGRVRERYFGPRQPAGFRVRPVETERFVESGEELLDDGGGRNQLVRTGGCGQGEAHHRSHAAEGPGPQDGLNFRAGPVIRGSLHRWPPGVSSGRRRWSQWRLQWSGRPLTAQRGLRL